MRLKTLTGKSGRKINAALIDQAVVSGSNFLSNIILAKLMGLSEFGVYSMSWLLVLLVSSLHAPLIVFPMMTIGPMQLPEEKPSYFGAVLFHQLAFSAGIIVLVFTLVHAVGMIHSQWHVAGLALALALATAAHHLQDFARRYFFVNDRPGVALFNDLITYGSRIILFVVILPSPSANATTAIYLVTLTSTVGFIAGLFLFAPMQFSPKIISAVARRHWQSGKWLTTSGLMQWTSVNIYLVAAGALLGSATVGGIKAAQNILGPAQILFQGLENIVPSAASRHYASNGGAGLTRYLIKVSVLGLTATAAMGLIAAIFAQFWLDLFYGDEFASYVNAVTWYAVIYTAMFFILPIRAGFRAIEQTGPWSRAYVITSLFSVATVYPLTMAYHLEGVMAGMLASLVLLNTLGMYYLRHTIRRDQPKTNNV